MNILFICHRIPYPPNKGDKIRSFNEIKYLTKEHNLYLAFLIDDRRDLSYVQELRKYCADLDYDVIRPRWKKIKTIPYLLTYKPLSIPYFYSKKLQDAIDSRLNGTPIDAIICFSSPMTEYVLKSKFRPLRMFSWLKEPNGLSGIKVIMDFVDVDSDKWRMYADAQSFPISSIFRREWKRLMNYEKNVGEIADWSIFVSGKEVELFKSFCPQARTMVIQNGVDFEHYNNQFGQSSKPNGPNAIYEPNRQNIIFIGAMDYFPNEDAVLYFFNEIWPYVKQELPVAKFFVVGGNPSKRVQSLSEKDQNVVITGYAQDVRPYFRMADIFIAPLRFARGVQNKVLEAMASGVPVVARSEAVQGLDNLNGCVMVENDNRRFALAILKVLKVPLKRNQMVEDSKRFVRKNHNWEENLSKLEKLLHEEV